MSRPRPTFADYVVIALSPALIMLLVGSLVFFLIEVFYQGSYDGRLTFIMAMFVMAAVLIGRISIEESREYAMLFAIPLAAVTALATFRFVEYSGPLKSFSMLINLGLIGLIWWCADRLTWDSTVIDESKDASGEGLLQTAGLDADATTQQTAAEPQATPEQPRMTAWQRFKAYRHRPHAPGVWVIYFSLAALPIFGFGNWFIPAEDLDTRRYVFRLLVVYVAAALGLLLTTSFLNLRRYLRQRRLEMPLEMAGTWIGTGAAMIVALLLICTLLPRRNPEYSVTQLPMFAGSPTDLWTTEHSVGNEGQEDPEKADRSGEKSEKSDRTDRSDKSQKSLESGDSQSNNKQSDQGKQSANGQDSQGKQSDQANGQNSQGKQSDQANKQSNQGKQSQADNQGTQSDKARGPDSQGKQSDQANKQPNQGEQSQADNENKQGKQADPQSQSQSAKPPQAQPKSKFDLSKVPSALGGTIGQLMKLVYWLVAIAVVGYFTWKYWRQIREALANFWKSLREFWDSLFGRKPVAGAEPERAVETAIPQVPFSAFHDPFLSGMAGSRPPAEVIRYSFEALEAWARERGCARGPEQTPQEFVQRVGGQQSTVARDAATLAEMYNRCAYARDLSLRVNIEPLRRLWEQLRASAAV